MKTSNGVKISKVPIAFRHFRIALPLLRSGYSRDYRTLNHAVLTTDYGVSHI
jgi:hypothetical protein